MNRDSGAPGSVPLESFRTEGGRPRTHPLELTLLWLVAAHLVFLPWALGTMRLWAQIPSLIAAALALVLALLPRTYTEAYTGGPAFKLYAFPKLLRFPIFWLGLALLGLVTLHGLNPAWEFRTDGKVWWMQGIPHIEWLPSGVRGPFERWGPWRMLMIYAAGWLTVCAIWVGFTRRRSLQRLLLVLGVNGIVLALFGIAERLTGAKKIFWFVTSPNEMFFASFIYKNHAGAYLNLALAIVCGLGGWYYLRGVRRMEKSNPSGVFAFLATCIAVSVLVSYARGATLITLAYMAVVVGAFVVHQWRLPREVRNPLIAVALLVLFGLFVKTGWDSLNADRAWERLQRAVSGQDVSVEARQIASRATLDALEKNWVGGIGAGSFRFLFPVYQQNYPDIRKRNGRGMYWEHAHNDVLQFPLEFGVPGMLLILGGFAYWGVALIRSAFWQNPVSAALVLGAILMLVMAWGDFVFQCPAILITWCVLWVFAVMWARFEESRRG
ncbi:O-antigen ligase family protein [Opitutus sp. ER46]|uniref:O-antigen ligase family protein n=1 Tax=Opitutus sp. ER46 TaxID=2161864 RepID=UPI000D478F3A|nr:O-antigen ligase family protein [Opitutus sp. ER46]PTX92355.1 hypothetical protein DB354_13535 [Opitutus sp. ER46]